MFIVREWHNKETNQFVVMVAAMFREPELTRISITVEKAMGVEHVDRHRNIQSKYIANSLKNDRREQLRADLVTELQVTPLVHSGIKIPRY
jgi:hypothetical protein